MSTFKKVLDNIALAEVVAEEVEPETPYLQLITKEVTRKLHEGEETEKTIEYDYSATWLKNIEDPLDFHSGDIGTDEEGVKIILLRSSDGRFKFPEIPVGKNRTLIRRMAFPAQIAKWLLGQGMNPGNYALVVDEEDPKIGRIYRIAEKEEE